MAERICTLADIHLTAHAPIRWGRRGGVVPYTSRITTSKERAQEIYKKAAGGEVKLKLQDKEFVVWVTALEPGPTPLTLTLVLQDVRWILPYIYIKMDANLKRLSTDRHIEGPRLEVAVQVPTTIYAPHSLDGGRPWDAKGFVLEVKNRIIDELSRASNTTIRGEVFDLGILPIIEVVNWRLDGTGDEVVGKLLNLVPGLQMEVDDTGALRFYSEAGLGDREQVAGLQPYADAPNDYPVIRSISHRRPQQITVMFNKVMELLFSYNEAVAETNVSSENPLRPNFDLINVVQVNEPEITYNGRTYGHGSWMPFFDYLAWLGSSASQIPPTVPKEAYPSIATVRKHFFSGFTRLFSVYVTGAETDPLWQRRWQTILSHYRQTFMVSQHWYDMLGGIEAVRSTVFDTVRNVRAPAEVYCNWTVRPTWRGVDLPGQAPKQFTVTNDVFNGNDTDDVVSAPFEVVVEDHEAMILRIIPRKDMTLEGDLPVPGLPTIATLHDASRHINDTAAVVQKSLWTHIEMQDEFILAVILSASVAVPNDNYQFHWITIYPDEAQQLIKTVNIGECEGPGMYVRIDPGVVEARGTWLDDAFDTIQNVVYEGESIPMNLLANPKILEDVAKAAAARIYESMAVRLDGSRVRVPFKPDMQPAGALAEVDHILNTDGRLYTSFSFFNSFEPRDLLAYLPEGTRRVIQRAVYDSRRR